MRPLTSLSFTFCLLCLLWASLSSRVQAAYTAPVAYNGTLTTQEDTANSGWLSASAQTGYTKTFSIVTNGQKGTATLVDASTGRYSYTPNLNLNGTDTFTFRVYDGVSYSNTATVTVTITPVDDSPVAHDMTLTTTQNYPITFLLDVTDPEGDAITSVQWGYYERKGTIGYGSTPAENVFTPDYNVTGVATYTYVATAGNRVTNTATITINILPDTTRPYAYLGVYRLNEDTTLTGTLRAADPENRPLTYSMVTQPNYGTATITDPATGAFTYTPNANFMFIDGFKFKVNNGMVDSAPAMISINITPIDDLPVAEDITVGTRMNIPVLFTPKYTDVDGGTVTGPVFLQSPTEQKGVIEPFSGKYRYTPYADVWGTEVIPYYIATPNGNSNTATITVNILRDNTVPVAADSSIAINEDSPVMAQLSASDMDGDPLSYSIVSQGQKGAVTILNAATGIYRYVPNLNANGTDTFTFKATDGYADSNTAAVTVTITPVNDLPIAQNFTVFTPEDTPVTFNLNVQDPEGDPFTAVTFTQPENKKGEIVSVDGQYNVARYTPNANANGTETIQYSISDGEGQSNVATLTVWITEVNDAPVVLDGTLTTQEEMEVTGTVYCTDIDGGVLTYAVIDHPTKGTVSLNSQTGNFTYYPLLNATGIDTFTFTAFDGSATSNVGTITVTIIGVNDAPLAGNPTFITDEDTPLTEQLVGYDVDGDALTYMLNSQPQMGTVTLLDATTGSFQYTPNLNANGTDTFTFRVKDSMFTSRAGTVTITIKPVSDPPVAHDMTLTTPEDTPITFNLDITDIDGGPYTALMLVQSGGDRIGTYEGVGLFAASFTPFANAYGTAILNYRIYENGCSSNLGTITMIVTPVNDIPSAIHGVVTTSEDQAISGKLRGADTENDPLTFALASQGTLGTAEVDSTTGDYTYTPNPNATGTDTFTFTVSDGTATSPAGVMRVNITPVNDAPVAQDGSVTTNEDIAVTGQLSASDADGDALTYNLVGQGQLGTVEIDPATGGFTYTPSPDVSGTDTFTFKVNDGALDSNTATITVAVNPVQDAPNAQDDALTLDEDAIVEINVLANDSDPDGDALTITDYTFPAHCSSAFYYLGNGVFQYLPEFNYVGADSFTYTVSDGYGNTDTATATITFRPVNDPPTLYYCEVNTVEDTPITGALEAWDPDGDALTYRIVTAPVKGTMDLDAATGSFTYTPSANATGSDSFQAVANDGQLDSNTLFVNVFISKVNDAPVASDGTLTVYEDTAAAGQLSASDADGDALTYSIVTQGQLGTVEIDPATGSYTYTPLPNVYGTDTFTFKTNDGTVDSNMATITVTISPVSGDAPVASDGTLTVTEDQPAAGTLIGYDPDGDVLTYYLVSQGQLGTVEIDPATGSFTYTPNPNACGDDAFTFKVNDGGIDSNTATVTVTINPVQDAPNAQDDALTLDEDATVNINVLANDSDPDGDALTIIDFTQPAHCSSVFYYLGNGVFQYLPEFNYVGADSFTYTVSDGNGGTATATATITFRPVNDPPTLNYCEVNTVEDTPVAGALQADDPDGDALTYRIVTAPLKGTLDLDAATGSFTFTPYADINGSDSFRAVANDGLLDSNTLFVSVFISKVNDAPIATDGLLITAEDTPATGTLHAGDVDGDALTYALAGQARKGMVELNAATGGFTYTPNANAIGDDIFTFTASDEAATSNTATVTITITGVNDAPKAQDGAVTTEEDAAVAGQLSASDADGDALTYSVVSQGQLGTVVIDATGRFTYTPDANTNGTDAFTFKANDGTTDSNTAAVTVTINAVNDTPVAVGGTLETAEDTPATGTLQANDVDGDALTFALAGQARNGTVEMLDRATGAYRYTPKPGFAGDDAFTFTASDGLATSNTATVTISITPVNDAPVAYNGTLAVVQGQTASGMLTGMDPEGSVLTFSLISTGSKGTATITNPATGAFTYRPNAGALGTDTFTFVASDGQATSNTATVTVTINTMPLTAVALSANPPNQAKPRTAITLTATPTGGTNVEYLFQYGVKKKGKLVWTTIRNYSTSPTCTWQMDTLGTYTLQVVAREVGSTGTVSNQLTYTIAKR